MRLILCFIFIFLSSCEQETQAPIAKVVQPVKTIILNSSAATQPIERIPGKVMASQQAELKFKVPGQLIKFPVKESQKVRKGQLLARLDPRDYKTNLAKANSQVSQARARLKAMKIGARPEDIKVLQAELAATKAQFEEAKQQYKRYRNLWKKRIISKADYDRQKSEYNVAKAHLNTAKQNLKKGKVGARKEDIEAMQAKIKGLLAQREETQNALDYTYLKAPFSGIIAETFVKNFQNVDSKDPILSIQDISKLEIIINLPEQMVISSKQHQNYQFVAIFELAKNRTFPLKLKEFKTEADHQTQTYRAVFIMQAPKDLRILPGMTTTMIITKKASRTNSNSQIFLAPVTAVFSEFNKQYVWIVQDDMTVHKREITVGELTKGSIQLLSNVKSGERIVTAGVHFLQEGMEVRLFETEEGY